MVNYNKSIISFSPNTKVEDRAVVCNVLQVHKTATLGRYLGMPINVDRNKAEVFNLLKEKVPQKLQGWAGYRTQDEWFFMGKGVHKKRDKMDVMVEDMYAQSCGGLGRWGKNPSYVWRILMEAMDVVKFSDLNKLEISVLTGISTYWKSELKDIRT
ncbi:hypothetical protein AgCh_024635 [Apium graveolens]